MLQPTDRIIAKTLVRILGNVVKEFEPNDDLRAAKVMTDITFEQTLPNTDLFLAVMSIVTEVREELQAEGENRASSNMVPQPWNEDAGSGL